MEKPQNEGDAERQLRKTFITETKIKKNDHGGGPLFNASISEPHSMERVRALHGELVQNFHLLDNRLEEALKLQEAEFLRAFRSHMYAVQKEIALLRSKADDATLQLSKSQRISSLEAERDFFKDQALRLDGLLVAGKSELESLRATVVALREDNDWLGGQLRAAKRALVLSSHELSLAGASGRPGDGSMATTSQQRSARLRQQPQKWIGNRATVRGRVGISIDRAPGGLSADQGERTAEEQRRREAAAAERVALAAQQRAAASRSRSQSPANAASANAAGRRRSIGADAAAAAADESPALEATIPPSALVRVATPGELRSLLSQCIKDARTAASRRRRSQRRSSRSSRGRSASVNHSETAGTATSGSSSDSYSGDPPPPPSSSSAAVAGMVSLRVRGRAASVSISPERRNSSGDVPEAVSGPSASSINAATTTTESYTAASLLLSPSRAQQALTQGSSLSALVEEARADAEGGNPDAMPPPSSNNVLSSTERVALLEKLLSDPRLLPVLMQALGVGPAE